MKKTIDRVNTLLIALSLPPVTVKQLQLCSRLTDENLVRYKSLTPAHDVLDTIDRHAGIITRFRHGGDLALLGERLARLERHIKARECPPYFYIGAEAEIFGARPTG